ncbi:hypothetical protein H6F86_21525 [Phormidium sp. FACHB-592]|uniref:Uncharacterized protein n=1 Tax=Stenomitos frigidus AS-A4 TaxID=2933935 RepID=A0ABV0KF22_9CYAN|nr:hypothetical protein [Phormidium sp. FACHB-592]MBD2076416.1 hypothetical protein [Phormidium sp. FACHB-592]
MADIDFDEISKKLVSKLMYSLGYSNEVYIDPDLQSALAAAYDLNTASRLGLMGCINKLEKDFKCRVFVVNGFSPAMKNLLGFGGGCFATKVNGTPTIVLDLNECSEIGRSINRVTASVAKIALLHEAGHIVALKKGESIQDEAIAWSHGQQYAGWLLYGGDHDVTLHKVQRYLALQRAA